MISSVLIAVLSLMHVYFFLAVWRKNFGLVDIAWGQGFILIALVSYFYDFNSVKNAVVLGLVLLWGLRLSLYLLTRNWNAPEDHRYQDLRKSWGAHPYLQAYFKVFLLQGALMLLISLPVTAGMKTAEPDLSGVNVIGVFVFFFGWIFESYSDNFLKKYKADPSHKGTICMSGPWKLCRFPNYFGEITLWYGIYLACFTPSIWWTIIGPMTIHFFIVKVSGIPLLEKRYAQRPEYHEYASRIPRLIPFTKPHQVKL
jgi:3-oxo-5-alpha-steroid 4-dehydrogenase 1